MFAQKKTALMLCLSLMFMLAFVAACGTSDTETAVADDQSDDQSEENGGNEAEGEQSAQEDSPVSDGEEQSRIVEHAMGTTELEQKPENVVVLFNGMVDISLALGVQPVGAVESWVQQPWYEYLRDDMDGVVNLGLETQPDLEQIVELDPDLIIGVKVRHEEIYEQLADIAPTVMAAEVHTWKDNMELAGEALYAEEEANAFFAEWDARVADFQEQMGDKLDMEVSFINFRADHSRIYAAGYTGLIFEELGFSRPENQRVDDAVIELTSKESIPEMDGDVIFEFTYDTGEDGAVFETQQDWKSHPLWETLNAVQQDQVYEVDEVAWNTAGGAQSAMMLLDDLYELFDLEQ